MKNSNLTCTFTGHRPERLELLEQQVIQWLDEQIRQAINDGYTEFTVGVEDDNERAIHIYHSMGFNEFLLRKQEEYQGDAYEYNLYLKRTASA